MKSLWTIAIAMIVAAGLVPSQVIGEIALPILLTRSSFAVLAALLLVRFFDRTVDVLVARSITKRQAGAAK